MKPQPGRPGRMPCRWRESLALLLLASLWLHPQAASPDRFHWGPLPPVLRAGETVPAQARAERSDGSLLAEFEGEVWIDAVAPAPPATVLITEVETINFERVEFTNVGDTPVDVSGWQVVLYDGDTWPAPKITFTLPPQSVCPPQSLFTLWGLGPYPGQWPAVHGGLQLRWGPADSFYYCAVRLFDSRHQPVDSFFAIRSFHGLIQDPDLVGADEWIGRPIPGNNRPSLSYQRTGAADHHTASDWVAATNSFGALNPRLQWPWTSGLRYLAVTPNRVRFAAGQWSGNLTVAEAGTHVLLRLHDGLGLTGQSDPLLVAPRPALTLLAPRQTTEANPGAHGPATLTAAQAPDTDLIVTLTSSQPSEVAPPTSLTLPAGTTQTPFSIANFDDTAVDGPQEVLLTATAPGYEPAHTTVVNLDDEPVTLNVLLPRVLYEGTVRLKAGVVELSRATATNLTVALASDQPDLVHVPTSVTVPTGLSRTEFTLVMPQNTNRQGNLTVTVTAAVAGWPPAPAQAEFRDDETLLLTLSVPSMLAEGSTNVLATVTAPQTLTQDLVVTLTSTAPDRLVVPPTVTIPAGQRSASFALVTPDDSLALSDVSVGLRVSGPGITSVTYTLTVTDNDLHHFGLSGLGAVEFAHRSLVLTVTCYNASGGTVAAAPGELHVTAVGPDGPVPLSFNLLGRFTNTTWQANVIFQAPGRALVLTFDDLAGHSGTSAHLDVLAGGQSDLSIADAVFDPARGRLWAAARDGSGADRRAILEIDPASRQVTRRLPLPLAPQSLALSDNGQTLYAALASTGGVIRVELDSLTVRSQFNVRDHDPNTGPVELLVVPGDPSAVIVRGPSGDPAGLALYRAGLLSPPRVTFTGPWTGGSLASLGSATELFLSQDDPAGGVRRLEVGPSGLTVKHTHPGFPGRLAPASGLLVGANGSVFFPPDFRRVGGYPTEGWPAPDPSLGQVFFLNGNEIQACDLFTFAAMGSLRLPPGPGQTQRLLRCGGNRLAITTSTNRFLVVEPHFLRPPAPAKVSFASTLEARPWKVGILSYCTLAVSNPGPNTVEQVQLFNVLPAGVQLESVRLTQGTFLATNGVVMCTLGSLAAGGAAEASLLLTPTQPGTLENIAWLIVNGVNPSNGLSRVSTTVSPEPQPPAVTEYPTQAQALVYDSVRHRLWFTTESIDGQPTHNLQSLDLATGQPTVALPLGHRCDLLALSANHAYLYAAFDHDRIPQTPDYHVRRYDLAANVQDLDFPVVDVHAQPHGVIDLAGLPAFPNGILVGRAGPQNDIALYENGAAIRRTPSDTIAGRLLADPEVPGRFFRLGGEYPRGELLRLQVDEQGISVQALADLLARPPAPGTPMTSDFKYLAGRLFSDVGAVANPATMTRLAMLPIMGPVETDPATGIVYYLNSNGSAWLLTAFDPLTLLPLWAARVPGVRGTPANLVRCGPRRLAFRTSEGQVIVINTDRLVPLNEADLEVRQTASRTEAAIGQTVTFSCRVTNLGPAPSLGIVVTNRYPPEVSLAGLLPSQGTARLAPEHVVWTVGNLSAGETAELLVTVTVLQSAALAAVAHATTASSDPVPGNNTTTTPVSIPPVPVADVIVRSFVSQPALPPGTPAEVTLTVSNAGPATALAPILTGTLRPGTVVSSVETPQGTSALEESNYRVTLESLPAGAATRVRLTITEAVGGLFLSDLNVEAHYLDPNPGNDSRLVLLNLLAQDTVNLVDELPLHARDLAYDPVRQTLLAAADDHVDAWQRHLVALDLVTLAPAYHVAAGEPLGRLAVSDDGRYAYAAVVSTGGVIRVDLTRREVDLRFPLEAPDAPSSPYFVQDMAVMPGQASTLAVARGGRADYQSALALFDDGQPRPITVDPLDPYASYFRLAFTDPTHLATTSPSGFQRVAARPEGLARVGPLLPGYGGDVVAAGGQVFLTDGRTLDPVNGLPTTVFPASGVVAPDPAHDRVYYFGGLTPNSEPLFLRAFHLATGAEIWSIPFRPGLGYEQRLILLGSHGIACLTDHGRAFVLRPDLVTPPTADLRLEPSIPIRSNLLHASTPLTLYARNRGPWPATGVQIRFSVPAGFIIQDANASQGTCLISNGTVTCTMGDLPSNAIRQLNLTLQGVEAGVFNATLSVQANELDPSPSNNHDSVPLTVVSIPVLYAHDLRIAEGDSPMDAFLNVIATAASPLGANVSFRAIDGTASAGRDFRAWTNLVVIGPNRTNQAVRAASILGNAQPQPDRFFFVELFNPQNATLARSHIKITIVDDDDRLLAVKPASIPEGHRGATDLPFDLTLSSPSQDPVRAEFTTQPGSASANLDYLARTGMLVFPPGATSLALPIPILGDRLTEPDETFTLLLTQSDGAVLSVREAVGTILDDDAPDTVALADWFWSPGGLVLRFASVDGKTYRLETTPRLPGAWSPCLEDIVGTGLTIEIIPPSDTQQAEAYFRLLMLP